MNRGGLFVTGTDTGVGKTHVARALARALTRGGLRVRARKPVESGWTDGERSDAARLREAAGGWEALSAVCGWRFREPVSPALAARRSGTALTVAGLAGLCRAGGAGFTLVEGAGGFLSPIAGDGLNADLARALGFPVLVVAADRLGAVNHALLTLEAVERRGLPLAGVVLNPVRPDAGGLENAREIRRLTGIEVLQTPHGADPEPALRPLLDALLA
jgi:dethiobiotin synthetase